MPPLLNNVSIGAVAIRASTNPLDDGMQCVELWYVTGIPGVYYPTKETAEIAARTVFPHEDPDRRYARIYYRNFYTEG